MKTFKILFLFCFVCSGAFSQTKDAGLWLGVKLDKEIVNDFSAQLEMESRLHENLTAVESAFFDLTLEYKISKFMDVGFDYRFGNKHDIGDRYYLRQRFAGNLHLDYGWDKIKFKYRMRYQNHFKELIRDEYGIELTRKLRHRFSMNYNLPDKYEIDVDYELFTRHVGDGTFPFSDWRVKLGGSKGISKNNRIELTYILQSQMNTDNPLMEYIFLITYRYDLD